ncbi:D-alanyl-lipoteichoic acid acyltransferase DltB (MBOAT superfamily) [Rhizomicrobium electricum]|nr:D-alanyl-lipoteichoic acid acyltransferase DltB (MBOAT superfamily) [Rhizomicrobium electricum]
MAMLFNSYEFVFFFLPVTFAVFFVLARFRHRLAAFWLAAASFFFYGWWAPRYVLLLLASIAFNYVMGLAIAHARSPDGATPRARLLLIAALVGDLALLGYYKYTDFFISSVNAATGLEWSLTHIVLPLGISFFTFTQIAFLVDVYRGIAREYNPIHYTLFASYFPHLIAGPVLHHKQMMPQFDKPETYRIDIANINSGMTIFAIGLFKKVIVADQFALYANPVFTAAQAGAHLPFAEAWIGALAYTFQLYFDFSAYSDMAIGLSRLFNVELPVNFNSPYKALNIIDFWRRWHMTLSKFLRDYLYISLGGNRRGRTRRYVNLMLTMVLGGLWHGANWTFVLWGTLHGLYLVVNHAWQALREALALPKIRGSGFIAGAITFVAVVVAWVVFRANDISSAWSLIQGMAGWNGFRSPAGLAPHVAASGAVVMAWLAGGIAVSKMLPNSLEIAAALENWRYRGRALGFAAGALFVYVVLNFNRITTFIYFQF